MTTALEDRPKGSDPGGVPKGPRRCAATSTTSGEQCRKYAMHGATVCDSHGGRAPQVRAAAARRLAERQAAASLADVDVVAIGNPLDELAGVAAEMRAFMRHAADRVAELDDWTGTNDAGTEHIRALVALYERASDRAARLLADWVRLGFDERMVSLHERQAELVERYVLAVVADLELTDEQQAAVPAAAVRHLTLLTGKAAA